MCLFLYPTQEFIHKVAGSAPVGFSSLVPGVLFREENMSCLLRKSKNHKEDIVEGPTFGAMMKIIHLTNYCHSQNLLSNLLNLDPSIVYFGTQIYIIKYTLFSSLADR
jgi:hypothetical protein